MTQLYSQKWSRMIPEGNSRPTVSVTEDLLFRLHVNCMFVEWSLRKNGISARNLFVKFEHNLK